ncbi:MAG: transposase, partial [Candidatus Micrarchaeia archaeon]
MKFNPEKYHRRSIRLKGYDYSQPGAYFITICTKDRKCLFGNVIDGKMILNDAGHIAQKCWLEIPDHYPNVILDEFIIMPNHIHGIIIINVGANNNSPRQINNNSPRQANDNSPQPSLFRSPSGTIGSIVRGFKIGVTKWFRQNTNIYDVWQRNY